MSRKTMLPGVRVENDKSLASSFQTTAYEIESIDNIGFVIDCNNVTDNTGTFAVQVRIREDENVVSDWVSLTLSSAPTLANAAAEFFVSINQLPPCEVRLSFTAAGGTPDGDCDIYFSGTQV